MPLRIDGSHDWPALSARQDAPDHELNEQGLRTAREQLEKLPLHILLYARYLAKCQRPQTQTHKRHHHKRHGPKFIRTLFSSVTHSQTLAHHHVPPPTLDKLERSLEQSRELAPDSLSVPREVSLEKVNIAHVAAATARANSSSSNGRRTTISPEKPSRTSAEGTSPGRRTPVEGETPGHARSPGLGLNFRVPARTDSQRSALSVTDSEYSVRAPHPLPTSLSKRASNLRPPHFTKDLLRT